MAESAPLSYDELKTRCERLAEEYSKLRYKTTVLKKAVIEEKSCNSKLTERVQTAELSQRKQEQEIEAFRFRNQQLAKRVEVLQADLDAAQAANSKKRGQHGSKSRGGNANSAGRGDFVSPPDQEVVMEQLQSTIEENARLNIELSNTRSAHDAELRRLQDSLSRTLEDCLKDRDKVLEERSQVQAECSMLKDEKLALENQLIMKEATLQQSNKDASESRQKLTTLQERFDEFKASVAISTAHVAANATAPAVKEPIAGEPATPPVAKVPASDAVVMPPRQSLLPCVQECLGYSLRLIRGLKEWHENHNQRFAHSYGPLRPLPELLDSVKKCTETAAALEQEVVFMEENLNESKPKLPVDRVKKIESALFEYLDNFESSIPMICSRIEDESALSFSPPTLNKRNNEIVQGLNDLRNIVSKLRLTFAQGSSAQGQEKLDLAQTVVSLRQCGKELARLFNCKVSLEQQTSELSSEIKAFNEALVHGLLVARTALDKLSVLMTENAGFFSSSGLHILREVLVEGGAQRSAAASKPCIANGLISEDATPSQTNTPNSQSQVSLISDEDAKRLQREVSQLRQTIKELEQARDSLGLEAQLEKMRREKEGQRRAELEKELLSLRSFPSSSDDATGRSNVLETSDLGGSPESTPALACDAERGENDEREKAIVRYYQDLVGTHQQQLYQLTGIAENLATECENLRAQWALSHKRNQELESDVTQLKAHSKGVTEDLDSTRRNYETQLSTLTEHIADMNDKLVERQENILDLKRQLESKESTARKLSFSAASVFSSISKRK